MTYRRLGRTGLQLFPLGFGTMRLPLKGSDPKQIDLPKAKQLICTAIDQGVNYVDTAYPYHGSGFAEQAVGEILTDGYRQKVYLGDKLSLWFCRQKEELTPFLLG